MPVVIWTKSKRGQRVREHPWGLYRVSLHVGDEIEILDQKGSWKHVRLIAKNMEGWCYAPFFHYTESNGYGSIWRDQSVMGRPSELIGWGGNLNFLHRSTNALVIAALWSMNYTQIFGHKSGAGWDFSSEENRQLKYAHFLTRTYLYANSKPLRFLTLSTAQDRWFVTMFKTFAVTDESFHTLGMYEVDAKAALHFIGLLEKDQSNVDLN